MSLRRFFLLCALEALAALVWLMSIPSEGGAYLGYSLQRLLLAAPLAAALAGCALLAWQLRRNTRLFSTFFESSRQVQAWLFLSCGIGATITSYLLAALLDPDPGQAAYILRLAPVLSWLDAAVLQSAFLLFRRSTAERNADPPLQPGSRWLPAFALLALLLPSANLARFDGFPLSHIEEFVLLVLLLPLLVMGFHLPSRLADFRCPLIGALAVVVVIKVLLFFSGVHAGFTACYWTPAASTPVGKCELSYENPLRRFESTRLDTSIDFPAGGWNLSFFNANRFNYYFWQKGKILRERIPFDAKWQGTVRTDREQLLRVRYVGEGAILFSGALLPLPPAYAEAALVETQLPAGEYPITLRYHFDDHYRTGDPNPPGLRPAFQAFIAETDGKQTGAGSLLLSPPLPWRALAFLSDFVFYALLVGAAAFHILSLGWSLFPAVAAASAGYLCYRALPEYAFVLPAVALVVGLTFLSPSRLLTAAWLAFLSLSLWRVLVYIPSLQHVLLRIAGADPLTHESFARSILESGSLEAGEKVFYAQPFFRYILYLLHLFFGDSDALRSAFVLALLNLGVLFALTRLHPRPRRWFVLLCAACMAWLLNANIVNMIQEGMTEYPTWIFLLFAYPLLAKGLSAKSWLPASILVGAAVITRTNQLPALLFLFAVGWLSLLPARWKPALGSLLVLGSLTALPVLHNWVYGSQVVFLPTTAFIPHNLLLPPGDLLRGWGDPKIMALFWTQVRLTLGIVDRDTLVVTLPMLGLLTCWLACIVRVLRRWKKFNWRTRLLVLLLPTLYLGVQFFYDKATVYPRHLVAGYLAMGLSSFLIDGQEAQAAGNGNEGIIHSTG